MAIEMDNKSIKIGNESSVSAERKKGLKVTILINRQEWSINNDV